MKAAVTGGSGFIGSHVVDKLKDAGWDVVVIDHRVPPHRQDVEFQDVDIVDFAATLSATKSCQAIFHLAAMSNVNHVFEQPVYSVQLNTVGTVNVLEAARQNKADRVFFASTVWVYTGARETDVHEDSPFYMPGAGHIYSSTKIASELYCHDYWELYKVPFTILRYGIPYGPRMREELVIPRFIKKALSGEALTIAGDGSQFRNFVYVEDMADAHILALKDIAKNKIYNVEGDEKITLKQIVEALNRLMGGKLKVEYTPARPGDYKGKVVSNARIKEELKWYPSTTFEDGLERTLDWFRDKYNSEKERASVLSK